MIRRSLPKPSPSKHLGPRVLRRLSAAVVCAILPLLMACAGQLPEIKPPQSGKGSGEILVDSPEVFARERLVRDREVQKAWLKKQLDVADEYFDAFQARVQTRSLTSRTSSLGIDATAATALQIRQADAQADTLDREQEIADLQHQIQVAELQSQLERALAGEVVSSTGGASTTGSTGGSTSGGTGGSGSSGGSGGGSSSGGGTAGGTGGTTGGSTGGGGSGSSAGSSGASGDGGGGNTPGAPGPPAFAASRAETVHDTPIDRFRDRLAYREVVRQELLENDLDDAHDLRGNTLYRLTFDTTLLPDGDETSQWARVQVRLEEAEDAKHVEPLLRGLLEDFEVFLQAESSVLAAGYLEEDIERLEDTQIGHWVQSTDPNGYFLGELEKSAEQDRSEAAQRLHVSDLAKSFANCEVVRRYREVLENRQMPKLASCIQGPDTCGQVNRPEDCAQRVVPSHSRQQIKVDHPASTVFTVARQGSAVACSSSTYDDLYAEIKTQLPDGRIETYAVTPKESAERIADAAVARLDEQRAVTLGLTLGLTNFNGAMKFLSILESQREAIRRRPLIVGYSNRRGDCTGDSKTDCAGDSKSFGWLLAPRFQPRDKEPGYDYRHRPVQLPLSAVVSVPSWWTAAEVEVKSGWGEPSTEPGKVKPSYTIELPGDRRRFLEALIPRARRPRPFFYGQTPKLQIGRREELAIFGENLWRNPEVFLGNQRAKSVEILPDMAGIVATFDKIQPPAGCPSTGPCTVDAWVWTSEGNENAGAVQLYRPPSPPQAKSPRLLFEAKAQDPEIGIGRGTKGAVSLQVVFDTKEEPDPQSPGKTRQVPMISEVLLEVEGASIDSLATKTANPAGGCLDTGSIPWKVTKTCQLELHFQSLRSGQIFNIKAFRKDGQKRIDHPAIEIEVD